MLDVKRSPSQSSGGIESNDNFGRIPEVRVRGRFILDRKIGAGSFGEIYHATDANTGKEVAIKFESPNIRRP